MARQSGAPPDNNWQALLDSGLLTSWPIYIDVFGRRP
jgi:hypothetical protein